MNVTHLSLISQPPKIQKKNNDNKRDTRVSEPAPTTEKIIIIITTNMTHESLCQPHVQKNIKSGRGGGAGECGFL